MDLLKSLGINDSVFYQLVILTITFFVCYFGAFRIYFQRAEKRRSHTDLLSDECGDIEKEIEDLKENYETKAKSFYKSYRKTYDEVVKKSTEQSKEELEKVNLELKQRLQKEQSDLNSAFNESIANSKAHTENLKTLILDKLGVK